MNVSENGGGKYVYCIIKSPGERKSFGDIGFGGGEVYTIEYKDIAVVISDTLTIKYDVDNEEDIVIHRTVVEQVMTDHSVIPVAYGMGFKNKKLVQIAMKTMYKAIKKASQFIDNKIELGVKVILPKNATDWAGNTDECKLDFLENLKGISAESKELTLFSKRLILNATFLVDKDKIDEFSDEMEQLGNKYESLKTQYSGPWPPYNFVDINVLSKKRGGFR